MPPSQGTRSSPVRHIGRTSERDGFWESLGDTVFNVNFDHMFSPQWATEYDVLSPMRHWKTVSIHGTDFRVDGRRVVFYRHDGQKIDCNILGEDVMKDIADVNHAHPNIGELLIANPHLISTELREVVWRNGSKVCFGGITFTDQKGRENVKAIHVCGSNLIPIYVPLDSYFDSYYFTVRIELLGV